MNKFEIGDQVKLISEEEQPVGIIERIAFNGENHPYFVYLGENEIRPWVSEDEMELVKSWEDRLKEMHTWGERDLIDLGYTRMIVKAKHELVFINDNMERIIIRKDGARTIDKSMITTEELLAIYEIMRERGWIE